MKICFLNGPYKGKEFSIKKGLILSRSSKKEEDISLKDPKASNPHAKIVKKKGLFYLQDMDSKNGTYVDKEINDLFALRPGLKFQIGKTLLQVKEEPKPQKPWNEIVMEELKKVSIENNLKSIKVIEPALILQFKSGVQKGNKWRIHYGPREAGSHCLDLPILDPQAPDRCFSLEPSKGAVVFKTLYPEKILINKKHISKKKLITGDCISFANTSIEVSYSKKT